MNRIYRSIWNQATGAYSAVSENVKSAGKRSLPGSAGGGAHFALTSMAAALMLGYGSLALAGPTGGTVVAGQANISGAPGSTVINQGSQNAVINWANFNINQGESVQFVQPNSNAVALNRVLGSDGTTILGNLSANGKVFIVNPNGVLFGKGAAVNTAGLVASTLDINNADFMAGKYQFSGNGTGKVLNQGSISAPGGYVALLGANVSNEGTIQARLGSVALAAGNAITLDVAGDGLLNVTVDRGAVGALVNNGGLIQADGGSVLLTAQAAGDLLKTVVNNTGVIEAHTIDTRGGTIKLLGDMQTGTVNAGGTLDASAPDGKEGSRGGFVETSAAHVNIANGINVTTRAANGLSGTWLIDPVDFNIAASGGNMTGADLMSSLTKGSVQIQSTQGSGGTAGDINVNDVVSWSANQLTLTAQNNVNINKPMTGTGTASLALEYGQGAVKLLNTSNITIKAEVNLPLGNSYSTKLGSDGTTALYTVINSLGAATSTSGNDLQGMKSTLSGNFALTANIDASVTSNTAVWGANGFTPIGTKAQPFTGQFDGLGHVITGLTSSTSTLGASAGLFGATSATGNLRNIGIVAPVISSSIPTATNYGNVAGLVGLNNGMVNNAYVSGGTVTSLGYVNSGGLVGYNYGTINNSSNSSTVLVTNKQDSSLGGLVGKAATTSKILNSYNTGTVTSSLLTAGGLVGINNGSISNSFNTGAVTGGTDAGGLVTFNRTSTGLISNSFNTGAVSGSGNIGGLAGSTSNPSQVNNSYSTGSVTNLGLNNLSNSNTTTGGLVGHNKGQINNSYATGTVTGSSGSGGLSGVGGVVGTNGVAGVLNNVYSSGSVGLASGATGTLGGIAGLMTAASSSINGGYFNVTLNPAIPGVGFNSGGGTITAVLGLTSTEMQTGANFGTFNFTTTTGLTGNNWVMVDTDGTLNNAGGMLGATGPMLVSEYSSTIKSSHQLQLMAMDLAGNYTLGRDVNAASTGLATDVWNGGTFIPVGASTATPFTGTLNGAGHVISGLVINRPGTNFAGLFGATSGTAIVRDIGLEGGSITGKNATGALVGNNLGLVSGSYSTASVSGGTNVGGLVGANGIVSSVPGIVTNSYASGAVTGTGIIGGLVGLNTGTLTNNYASGSVIGGTTSGGLAGSNSGTVTGNFWDSTTSSITNGSIGTPLTTAQMKSLSTYSGAAWDLAGAWIVYDSYTYPLLRAFMTPLQVTFAANASKTYDGTSSWTAPVVTNSNAYGYAALQGSLNYGAAGTAVNAGTYAITADGLYSGQHGYAITANSATLTINKLGVTLSGASVASRAYNGTTAASLLGGTLNGVLSQDNVNIAYNTGTFDTKDAGTGKTVTALLTGSASGNYSMTTSGLTGIITPKALTLTGLAGVSRQYDGLTSVTLTGGTLLGLVGSEVVTVGASSGSYANANAGSGKAITVVPGTLGDGTGLASNYSLAAPTGVTGAITTKLLTWSGLTAANKVYDGTISATVTGGSLNGMVGSETVTWVASGLFSDKNAANGKTVTVSTVLGDGSNGGLAANYRISNSVAPANVTKKALTLTGATANNKVYDGLTTATFTGGTLSGFVGSETVLLDSLAGSFGDKNAGSGKAVTITGGTLSNGNGGGLFVNYSVGSVTGLSANIAQKALTVSGVTVGSKAYDGNTSATVTGGTLSGMVSGETLGLSGQTGEFSDKNAANGKTVTVTGATLVNGSGLASNYTVSNATGATGNITQKALTIDGVTAADKVYDGNTAATLSGGALTGLAGSETLGLSSLSGVFGDKNAGASKAVTVSGGALSDGGNGGLASNYTVGAVTGVTASITQKALTLSGVSASAKAYDGNANATLSGGTLSGMVGGETVTVSGQSGTFSDKNAATGKTVTVSGVTLADGSGLASNYSVAAPTGLTADITKKALTISGITAANRAYTGTTAVSLGGTVILDGLVGAEGVGVGGMVGVFADKNVGTGKAVTITGAVMTVGSNGGQASNYTISNPTGVTANITKATITSVTNIVTDSKVYDGGLNATVNAAGATFNGIKLSDSLTLSATTAAFANKNVGNGKTVSISGIALSGTDAGNYNLASSTSSSTGNITPKALTVSGLTAGTRAYDGTATATLSGGTLNGVISGETLVINGGSALFADKNVGAAKTVTVSVVGLLDGTGLASNYSVTNPTGVTGDITPKALTVSGMTAGSKVYDGLLAATLAGGSLNGLVSGETLVLSGGSGVYGDKNAGAAKAVTVSGVGLLDGTGLASNYSVTNPTGVTGTITQKALTLSGTLSASDKVYDGLTAAAISGGAVSGFVGTETVSLSGLSGAFADKNAGNAKAVTVSGATLADGSNGGLASNYSVGVSASLTASITPKALTVIGATAANRVYDGTLNASISGGALNGLVGSETVGLATLSGAFVDKNVGTAKAVAVSGAGLTDGGNGGLAANYTVATPSGLVANVTKATIGSLSNITTADKVYDASTKATVSGATFNGMASGDSLSLSGTAVFADKNVGTAKAATVSALTLGGLDAANYNLTPTTGSGTGNITPKAITVVGMTALNKIYDGNTKATLSGGSLSGLVGSETLGLSGLTATFDDKNAGAGKTLTATGSTLVNGGNGGLASNYSVTDPTGLTASITQKALTVTGMTAGTRVYDGTTAASLSGGALSGLVSGETLVLDGGSGAFADKNAGAAKAVTVSGVSLANGTGQASNYTVTNPTTVTGSITQKALTVSGATAGNKTYDGTDTATLSGGALNGLISGETLALSAVFADKNAAAGKTVTVGLNNGSGLAGNYVLNNPTGLTAAITPKALTVSGVTAGNKTYDGNKVASLSGGTLSGLVGTETLALSGQSGEFSDQNAGNGKTVTVSGATLGNAGSGATTGLASNYTVSNATGVTANIAQKALTVSGATALDKTYDGNTAAALASGTLDGLVGSETLALSAAFADKNAAAGKAVTVGLNDGSGLAGNYVLNNPTGLTANIDQKALTVTGVTAGNKTYDGSDKATLTGGVLNGLVGTETLSLSGQSGVFSDKNAGTNKDVTVSGATLGNAGSGATAGLASNYTIKNATGVKADIGQKQLTVSGATALDKTYDGNTAAALAGGTLDGLVDGETLALSAAFADKNAAAGKAVTIGLNNGSGLAGNYVLNNPTGLTAAITPKALTVSGVTADNKTYDGNKVASLSGGTLSGLVGAETLALSGQSGEFSDQNAGSNKDVKVSGATLGDAGSGATAGLASNYTVSNAIGVTANIAQKALTVSGATALDKTYDGNTAAALAGGTLDGLVGSETLALSAAFADKNAAVGKAVTVGLNDGRGLAGNYVLNNPTGLTAAITPKALTVSGVTAGNKTYDGALAASLSGGTLDGLVGTETLSLSGQSGVFGDKNAGSGKTVTVSGATLGDAGSGATAGLASNYTVSNATGVTANIAQKALTVSGATALDKTYDGNTAAALAGGTLDGLVGSETLALSAAFADKNAAAGKAVTVGLNNGSGLAGNYVLNNPTGLTAAITPKALTVSGVTAGNKTYDGALAASLSGGTLNGLVGTETLSLSGQSGVFSDKNVGIGKTVTVSGATLGDAGSGATAGLASNYTVGNATGVTANIAQKALTVSGATALDKTYDGNTAAALAGGTLDGLVGSETLALSAAFADKNAAAGKAVTVGLNNGSGLAGNYVLNNPTGLTAAITPKALTVSGVTAGNKTYDGALAASLSGGTLNGLVGTETLSLSGQSGVFSDKNVGIGKTVTVSGATLGDAGSGATAGLASNYTVGNATGVTANIAQKALTVSGATALDKTYDGNTAAALAGGALDGLVDGETLALSAAFADKNAAAGKAVTIGLNNGSGLAGNYVLNNPTGLTAAITPKALTVSGVTAGNKTYDGALAASLSGGTLNGLVGTETLSLSGQSGVFSDKNVGIGKTVTVSGATLGDAGSGATAGLASNYTVGNATGVKADIAQKQLTVGGISAGNKVYDGGTAAVLDTGTATFGGLVTGDSLNASASGAFSDKNAAAGKTVNISGIVLGGVDAGNYTLDSTTATATADITAKALTVTGQLAGNKVYDGNMVASLSGGALSGLADGETLGIAGQTAVFSDKNAANGKTVTVTGTTLVDTATGLASNYSVSNPTGLTASITAKALTVTGQLAGNKVYDGNAQPSLSGGALSGLVAGETLGIAGQTAVFSDKNAANGKTVTVTGTTLVDTATGLASNYSVSNPTGLTASITPKALTVAGQLAANKVYDGTATAQLSGGVLAGLAAGESLGLAGQVATFADKNAATAKAVTVTGTALVDTGTGLASNYTVSNPTGLTASITPASLLVRATGAASRVYDTTANASVTLADNRIAGDVLTISNSGASFADKNAGANKTVTVNGIALGGADAANYLVNTTATTTASITQAALGVTVDNAEKDQGRANPAFTASYTGLIGGDTLANEVSGSLAFSTPATTGSPSGSYLVAAAGQASTNYALTYTPGVLTVNPTEALQSAVASVLATVNVAPSQGNMVQAEVVAKGETVTSKEDAVQVAVEGSVPQQGSAPVVQTMASVNSNVLPGLRLKVVDAGMRLPAEAGSSSVESE